MARAARETFPYSIECKNQEKVNLWESYKQADDNSGKYEPIVFIKRNNHKPLVVVDANYFINLHKNTWHTYESMILWIVRLRKRYIMTYKLDNLEVTDVQVDGLDMKDYPDFVDAYIDSAKFVSSGKELDDVQLEKLQEQNVEKFYEDVMDKCIDIADMHYSDNGV